MSKRSKVTADDHIVAAKACTEGKMSQSEAATQLDIKQLNAYKKKSYAFYKHRISLILILIVG